METGTAEAEDVRSIHTEFRNLHAATSRESFIRTCRAIVTRNRDVHIPEDFLPDAVMSRTPRPDDSGTTPVRHPGDLRRSIHDLLLGAALNGGYFHRDADGRPAKWGLGGSGTAALCDALSNIQEAGAVPGDDVTDPAEARRLVAPHLAAAPFGPERLDVAAAITANAASVSRLIDRIEHAVRTPSSTVFDLDDADAAAHAVPEAFAGDPFRKKAILFLTFVRRHIAANGGIPPGADLPLPADYQIPRILEHLGGIRTSDRLRERIAAQHDPRKAGREASDMHPDDADSAALRAAAVVCGADAARAFGVPDVDVDAYLFTRFRGDPTFETVAPLPMRCITFRF